MQYKFCLRAYMESHKHQLPGPHFILKPGCNKIYLNLGVFYKAMGLCAEKYIHGLRSYHPSLWSPNVIQWHHFFSHWQVDQSADILEGSSPPVRRRWVLKAWNEGVFGGPDEQGSSLCSLWARKRIKLRFTESTTCAGRMLCSFGRFRTSQNEAIHRAQVPVGFTNIASPTW